MAITYHIRIKKEYASAIIDDLRKKDALEFVPEEEAFEVPQWQKDEVRKRIEKYTNNPELFIDEDSFFKMFNED